MKKVREFEGVLNLIDVLFWMVILSIGAAAIVMLKVTPTSINGYPEIAIIVTALITTAVLWLIKAVVLGLCHSLVQIAENTYTQPECVEVKKDPTL